jgi:hypothetical protein
MSRTRHVVFGTGETIAGTVYGTIVVLAALVAGARSSRCVPAGSSTSAVAR